MNTTNEIIIELENRLLIPNIRKSYEEVNQLIADDFEEFGSSGRKFNKLDIINGLLEEQSHDLIMSDAKVIKLGHDVRLITYTLKRDDTKKTLRSSIWRLINGSWQMVFHQGTPTKSTN